MTWKNVFVPKLTPQCLDYIALFRSDKNIVALHHFFTSSQSHIEFRRGVNTLKYFYVIASKCTLMTSVIELFSRTRWTNRSAQKSKKYGILPWRLCCITFREVCHKHNSLPLGPILPSPPSPLQSSVQHLSEVNKSIAALVPAACGTNFWRFNQTLELCSKRRWLDFRPGKLSASRAGSGSWTSCSRWRGRESKSQPSSTSGTLTTTTGACSRQPPCYCPEFLRYCSQSQKEISE